MSGDSVMLAMNSFGRRLVVGCSLLTFLMLAQCACQKGTQKETSNAQVTHVTSKPGDDASPGKKDVSSTKKPKLALPESLDLKDLDDDEKAVLHAVLKDQFDPCGKSISFLDSLKQPKPCARALSMGKFVVGWVVRGLSKKQITVELLKKLKKTATKVTFNLKGTPYLGDPKSKWVIVEFTDFQCPFCKQVSKPLKDLAKKYNAALYIKHFPLTDIHPVAKLAALAASAAHKQGKFWPVYDALFKNQELLSDATIRQLVKQAGVDMTRYDKDIKHAETGQMVDRDLAEGEKIGVDGTPMIYLNGEPVEFDALEEKLNEK